MTFKKKVYYTDFLDEIKAYREESCVCLVNSLKNKIFLMMIKICPILAFASIRLYKHLEKINGSCQR